jgi:exopolysaccharide biosynthesis polyprenyl glycosylphosphotransferase
MNSAWNERRDGTWVFYALADVLAVIAAYYGTILVRFYSQWGERLFGFLNRVLGVRETGAVGEVLEAFYVTEAPRLIVILCVVIGILYGVRHLYAGWRFISPQPIAWNVVVANTWALLIFYTYFYLSRNVFHPRSFFFSVLAINTVFCLGLRSAVDGVLRWVRRRLGWARHRAVLVGSGEAADFLAGYIEVIHPHGIWIAARVPRSDERDVAGLCQRTRQTALMHRADLLIVAEKPLSVAEIMRLIETADELDLPIKVLSDKLNVIAHRARLPTDVIHDLFLVHFDAPSTTCRFDRIRRHLSILGAAAGLILTAPLMLVIALVVAATSPGGVFFVQERIGVNRKPFRIIKFRTMRHRAEEEQATLEELNESGTGLFKIRRDPRVTPVGRFLRRFSLDELPQLINVLKGDMLLIGPRPLPRRDFQNYYEEWHYSRHAGLPGLTCLWQVSGRSDIGFEDMCILDIYYLRNRTWVLDLQILFRTIWVVLFGRGAY